MKSITQIDQEQDTKYLISLFLKLIGLKELSHQVNFKRKSKFDLVWLFSYLLELRFSRHSLFRAGKIKTWDQCSLAGKRRSQARRQMNNVTVELIKVFPPNMSYLIPDFHRPTIFSAHYKYIRG